MSNKTVAESVFEVLKDNIQFDTDIEAITRILKYELKNNKLQAEQKWEYILNNYSFKNMLHDLDITPIFKTFPLEYIKLYGLTEFLKLRKKESSTNKFLIDNNLFNTQEETSGINILFKELIASQDISKELETINALITCEEDLPKEIFDYSKLLESIIKYHLKEKPIDAKLFNKLISTTTSKKEQALLKSLLFE